MKSDIEGNDMVVLSSLILKGYWCYIDVIYAEDKHFTPAFNASISVLMKLNGNCNTSFIYLDDETYNKERLPFSLPNENI